MTEQINSYQLMTSNSFKTNVFTQQKKMRITNWKIYQFVSVQSSISGCVLLKILFFEVSYVVKVTQTEMAHKRTKRAVQIKTEAQDYESDPAKCRYSTQSFCPVLDSGRGANLTLQWVWPCRDELL